MIPTSVFNCSLSLSELKIGASVKGRDADRLAEPLETDKTVTVYTLYTSDCNALSHDGAI